MITKYAATEIRQLIRSHATTFHTWATKDQRDQIPQSLKDDLLALAARLYEIVEDLPVEEAKTHLHS